MPTHYTGNDLATRRALDTYIKLSRASASVSSVAARSIATAGLTTSQFGVLEAVFHLGPLCQTELARRMLVTGGNLTTVLRNLERDGLVERANDPSDQRRQVVTLTAAGRKQIAAFFPRHAEDIRAAMASLSPAEQTTLGNLCKKLGQAIMKGDKT